METKTIVFDWKVNNLKELFAREGSEPILSKPFDLERWRVVFYPRSASCQDEHVCALYIQAVPSPEDVMLANAERARLPRPAVADAATWKRAETKYTLSILHADAAETVLKSELTSDYFGDGLDPAKSDEVYWGNDISKSEDYVIIRCQISHAPVCPSHVTALMGCIAPVFAALSDFGDLDDPYQSDVCFRFKNHDQEQRIYMRKRRLLTVGWPYFSPLFESGFAESKLIALPVEADSDAFTDQDDDCDAVEPWDVQPGKAAAVGAQNDEDDTMVDGDNSQIGSRKRQKVSCDDMLRPMHVVDVDGSRYITYRALLHYINTYTISYTPLASSYAVALAAAEADDEPLDYPSRWEYLLACVDSDPNVKPHADCPCSPQALYCLLDELDICVELKERTHGHIVSCYTVDNIAYEVFSQFNAKFPKIQTEAITYLVAHWSEVIKSAAWKRVVKLVAEGELEGSEDILSVIFSKLTPSADVGSKT